MSMFSIGLSGLNAAQNALNTTSNNISNVYTPGYNRELTLLGEQQSAGGGVQVNDIQRQFDHYVADQLNAAGSKSSALQSYQTQVSRDVRLGLSGSANFRSRFYLDPSGLPERSQGDVLTLASRASLAFERSGIEISIWGRNLTNRDYAVSGYGFIGYNTFRSDPRTFGGSVSITF